MIGEMILTIDIHTPKLVVFELVQTSEDFYMKPSLIEVCQSHCKQSCLERLFTA